MSSMYARAIRRAAEIMRGYEQLAAHLDVKLEELMQWAQGFEKPPTRVFLMVADVIARESAPQASRARPPQ